MDWHNIPSLAALRAFESACRTGNLTAAATELNVTHAAIAQHIRALHDYFGEPLIKRQGNRMVPTAAGQKLSAELNLGFGAIISAVRDLTADKTDAPLVISTTSNFAENWLMPRLPRFWSKHPDIPLAIRTSHDLVNFQSDGVDLAIRYGRGNWAGTDNQLLTEARFVICGSAQIVCDVPRLMEGDLSKMDWLFDENHLEPIEWAKEEGWLDDQSTIRSLPTMGSVRAALATGSGIAVLMEPLVKAELDAGTIIPIARTKPRGVGYYIVTRKGSVSSKRATFIKWLRSEASI